MLFRSYQVMNSVYFDGLAALTVNTPNLNIGLQDFQISYGFKTDGAQMPYAVSVNSWPDFEFGNSHVYPQYNDNQWHHVLMSRTNGTFTIAVDNTTVQSYQIQTPINMTGIQIGKSANPTYASLYDNAFKGWIANFIISTTQ